MSRIVIAAYRPRPGQERALEALMRRHHQRLYHDGLVADRPLTLMRARDGTMIEQFEWLSREAETAARASRPIQQLRAEYPPLCDRVPLGDTIETHGLQSEFDSIEDCALHPEFSP
ncbi:MAG TPA: hypothetical protein PK286_10995 [Devosia sp.]|nr:hypothetical protein [Devosia sp.]